MMALVQVWTNLLPASSGLSGSSQGMQYEQQHYFTRIDGVVPQRLGSTQITMPDLIGQTPLKEQYQE